MRIKPTDALDSNFIRITTLHVSGSLSAHHQEFLAVHRHWYILCSCDDRLLPVFCMLIDVAIPGDRNVIKKEAEKILKHKDLTIEIQRM